MLAPNDNGSASSHIRTWSVALYMAMTNLSGVPASHIFQASDKPYYHKGFKILFVMAALAIAFMVAMRVGYQYLNRKADIIRLRVGHFGTVRAATHRLGCRNTAMGGF